MPKRWLARGNRMRLSIVALFSVILTFGSNVDLKAEPVSQKAAVRQLPLPDADWSSASTSSQKISAGPLKASADNTKDLTGADEKILLWCGKAGTSCTAEKIQKYRRAVRTVTVYLRDEYGPPIYTETLSLVVSNEPNLNGRMTWHSSKESKRIVKLNEFNFIESEWRVLAHELFHALYQSNDLLTVYPDFVSEGLAVYAEYRYRYRKKTTDFVASTMRDHLKGLGYPGQANHLDFNIPFAAQGPQAVDIHYVLSGYYFMSQDPTTFPSTLQNLLHMKQSQQKPYSWTSLQRFTLDFGLVVPEVIPLELAARENSLQKPLPKEKPALPSDAFTFEELNLCTLLTTTDFRLIEFVRSVIDSQKYKIWVRDKC